eukprot:3467461-Rhodomonas_salina.3
MVTGASNDAHAASAQASYVISQSSQAVITWNDAAPDAGCTIHVHAVSDAPAVSSPISDVTVSAVPHAEIA